MPYEAAIWRAVSTRPQMKEINPETGEEEAKDSLPNQEKNGNNIVATTKPSFF